MFSPIDFRFSPGLFGAFELVKLHELSCYASLRIYYLLIGCRDRTVKYQAQVQTELAWSVRKIRELSISRYGTSNQVN